MRERERLVFSIEANYSAWERAGLVTVASRLDPANLARAEATILAEIRAVRDSGVTAAELNRAKAGTPGRSSTGVGSGATAGRPAEDPDATRTIPPAITSPRATRKRIFVLRKD